MITYAKKSDIVDTKKTKTTKVKKTNSKANTKTKVEEKKEVKKKSLWVRFRIFCHGVGSEFKKVNWPSKNDMIKYSGSINVEEGEYGITLFKELVEGESVIIETFQMPNTLAVFIIMYIISGILILIVVTIVFIKK